MFGTASRVIGLFAFAAATACSNDDGSGSGNPTTGGTAGGGSGGGAGTAGGGSGGTTAGSSGTAGSGGSSDGSTCSPYPMDAPVVTGTLESGAPPAMTGGPIIDGKYWLTAIKYYATETPHPLAERIDLARGGTYFDTVSNDNGVERRNGTSMSINGEKIAFTISCGLFEGTTGTVEYTATATQFTALLPNRELKIYTKQ